MVRNCDVGVGAMKPIIQELLSKGSSEPSTWVSAALGPPVPPANLGLGTLALPRCCGRSGTLTWKDTQGGRGKA